MRLDLAPDRRVRRLAVNDRGVLVSVLECGHSVRGRPSRAGEPLPCKVCAPDHFFALRGGETRHDDFRTCARCRALVTLSANVCPRCGWVMR